MHDYTQVVWNDVLQARAAQLAQLALDEDLNGEQDWTTTALVPTNAQGAAKIVARKPGVVAGMPLVVLVCGLVDPAITVEITAAEGTRIAAGDMLARLSGPARSLLIADRTAKRGEDSTIATDVVPARPLASDGRVELVERDVDEAHVARRRMRGPRVVVGP